MIYLKKVVGYYLSGKEFNCKSETENFMLESCEELQDKGNECCLFMNIEQKRSGLAKFQRQVFYGL